MNNNNVSRLLKWLLFDFFQDSISNMYIIVHVAFVPWSMIHDDEVSFFICPIYDLISWIWRHWDMRIKWDVVIEAPVVRRCSVIWTTCYISQELFITNFNGIIYREISSMDTSTMRFIFQWYLSAIFLNIPSDNHDKVDTTCLWIVDSSQVIFKHFRDFASVSTFFLKIWLKKTFAFETLAQSVHCSVQNAEHKWTWAEWANCWSRLYHFHFPLFVFILYIYQHMNKTYIIMHSCKGTQVWLGTVFSLHISFK